MDQTAFLRSLRAVRRFSDEPIPDEVLHDILETARWTGSSKNSQPWELVVVQDRSTLEQLARLGQFAGHLAGARVAIVLVMENARASLDAGRLAHSIMLAAWAHGIGSCIGSLYPEENERQARELLGVPPERSMRTAISLGYPADEEAHLLSRSGGSLRAVVPTGRKPLGQLVSWDRYGQRGP